MNDKCCLELREMFTYQITKSYCFNLILHLSALFLPIGYKTAATTSIQLNNRYYRTTSRIRYTHEYIH